MAPLLRHRPCAKVVLALDGATHVDLVGAALRRLSTSARRLRQPLVDDRPHRRRTAKRSRTGRLGARSAERAADWCAGGRGTGFNLLGLPRGRRLGCCPGGLVKALLHQSIDLALGFVFKLATRLLLGQPLLVLFFGGSPLLVLGFAALGVLSRALPRDFGIAICINQGARARFLLFLGQCPQDDATGGALGGGRAGWRRRRGRRARRCSSGSSAELERASARCRSGDGRWRRGGGRGGRSGSRGPLDRLLGNDFDRARTPVRELLQHLGGIALCRRRTAARRVRKAERFAWLVRFFLFRHLACCPWYAADSQREPVNRR